MNAKLYLLPLFGLIAACAAPPNVQLVHPKGRSAILGSTSDIPSRQALAADQPYVPSIDSRNETNRLAGQVVKLSVSFDTQNVLGSGFVICRTDSTLFIMTAAHVVTGVRVNNLYDEGETHETRRPQLRELRIAFRGQKSGRLKADASNVAAIDPELDIALLRVNAPGVSSGASVIGPSSALSLRDAVLTFGHSSVFRKQWMAGPGEVVELSELIVFRPGLEEGYSGAPLFSDDEKVRGIVTNVLGSSVTQAVPIERAVRSIREGLAPRCTARWAV